MVRALAVVVLALFVALSLAGCSSKKGDQDKDDCPSSSGSKSTSKSSTSTSTTTSGGATTSTHTTSTSRAAASLAGLAVTNSSSSSSQSSSKATTSKPSAATACPTPSAAAGTGAHALTFTAAPSNGSVPLNVTYTFDVTGKLAATTWTLAFGDGSSTNGTSARLPGNATHRYVAAGNLTAWFNVTFGDGAKVAKSVNLTLAAGGPAPGTVLGTESIQRTGTINFGVQAPGCGDVGRVEYAWALNATFNGTAAVVQHVTIHFLGAITQQDVDIAFLDPSGAEIGSSTTATSDETIDQDGPFVAGEYTIQINPCVTVAQAYTVDAVATYVAV